MSKLVILAAAVLAMACVSCDADLATRTVILDSCWRRDTVVYVMGHRTEYSAEELVRCAEAFKLGKPPEPGH